MSCSSPRPSCRSSQPSFPPERCPRRARRSAPLSSVGLYEKFAAFIGTDAEVALSDAGASPAPETPGDDTAAADSDTYTPVSVDAEPRIPDPWTTIAVGSIVLASVSRDDGWWECVVLAVEPSNDTLTLSWRDWPRMPSFR